MLVTHGKPFNSTEAPDRGQESASWARSRVAITRVGPTLRRSSGNGVDATAARTCGVQLWLAAKLGGLKCTQVPAILIQLGGVRGSQGTAGKYCLRTTNAAPSASRAHSTAPRRSHHARIALMTRRSFAAQPPICNGRVIRSFPVARQNCGYIVADCGSVVMQPSPQAEPDPDPKEQQRDIPRNERSPRHVPPRCPPRCSDSSGNIIWDPPPEPP